MTDDINRNGGELRAYLERNGITIAELSRRTGLLYPAVHVLVRGRHAPTATTKLKVARGLKVKIADIWPNPTR